MFIRRIPEMTINNEVITPIMTMPPSVQSEKSLLITGEMTTLPRTILEASTKYLPISGQNLISFPSFMFSCLCAKFNKAKVAKKNNLAIALNKNSSIYHPLRLASPGKANYAKA
jgi:hypothetical protein